MTKRQFDLAPRLVSEKAPNWRFLDGVCYDGNRGGSHYFGMDGLAGFEYGSNEELFSLKPCGGSRRYLDVFWQRWHPWESRWRLFLLQEEHRPSQTTDGCYLRHGWLAQQAKCCRTGWLTILECVACTDFMLSPAFAVCGKNFFCVWIVYSRQRQIVHMVSTYFTASSPGKCLICCPFTW